MRIRVYGWELIEPLGESRPAVSQEDLVRALREMREVLLKESDWTQMPDVPLSEEIKNDWRIWRQQIRDITNTVSYPLQYTVPLPEPPVTGRPPSWDNWDLDVQERLPKFNEIEQEIYDNVSKYIEHHGIQ
jgi:hypothetical protein